MKFGFGLSTMLITALLTAPGCTRIRIESEKRAALVSFMDSWKGKPVREFLQVTGWLPTGELDRKHGLGRTLIFDALGAQSGGGGGGALTYHQVTTWTNGIPATTASTGANQPLGMVPPNSVVSTERLPIPRHGAPSRLGCQLTLGVNADGNIHSWVLEGSECFEDTLNRLKRR